MLCPHSKNLKKMKNYLDEIRNCPQNALLMRNHLIKNTKIFGGEFL